MSQKLNDGAFTIKDMSALADEVYEGIEAIILNPKFKAEKQKKFRIRLAWKEYFREPLTRCDDGYTENVLNAFAIAVGYKLDNMSMSEATKFIHNVLKTMKEV